MVDGDSYVSIASQQILSSAQNELLFSSRYKVVRQAVVRAVRRHAVGVPTAAFQTHLRTMSLEWRNESVALADDRLDEARVFGIISEGSPDFADRCVDCGLLIDEHIRIPECRVNLGAIDQDAGVPDEEDQYLHRNLLELEALTCPPQRVCGDIEFELAKTEAARHG